MLIALVVVLAIIAAALTVATVIVLTRQRTWRLHRR